MENFELKPIGQIVAEDIRTLQVFESHRIDFYNDGPKTLQEAADENDLAVQSLADEIEKAKQSSAEADAEYDSWELDKLANHIIEKHHKYANEKMAVIKPQLEKIVQEHGNDFSELPKIKELFDVIAGEIAVHQKKEELMLFPFIRKMADAKKNHKPFIPSGFTRSAVSPVETLTQDHRQQSEAFEQIVALTKNYTAPENVCNEYQHSLEELKAFEANLHRHLHLENNILFPKALSLEKELNA